MQKTNNSIKDNKTKIKYLQLEFYTHWINKIKSFFTYVRPKRIALYAYLDKNALINFLLNNYDISNIYWIELIIKINKQPTSLFIAQFKDNKKFIDAKGNIMNLNSEQEHYLNSKIANFGNIRT